MSSLFKNMMQQKLRQLTLEELLHYAERYEFSITRTEGEDILHYIQNNPIDPFSAEGREEIFHDLSDITSKNTALKAERLFEELVGTFNLGHFFEE